MIYPEYKKRVWSEMSDDSPPWIPGRPEISGVRSLSLPRPLEGAPGLSLTFFRLLLLGVVASLSFPNGVWLVTCLVGRTATKGSSGLVFLVGPMETRWDPQYVTPGLEPKTIHSVLVFANSLASRRVRRGPLPKQPRHTHTAVGIGRLPPSLPPGPGPRQPEGRHGR